MTFFDSFIVVLINMATILMPANLATPGLLKMWVFQNKGYDVTISDVTTKVIL